MNERRVFYRSSQMINHAATRPTQKTTAASASQWSKR